MLSGDASYLGDVVVLELVDVPDDLALVRADRREQKQVLQVLVVAERRWLDDDLLEQLDELDRHVGGQEGFDGDRHIVRVGALRNGRGHDLHGNE
jgi:hypothetical protein